jgi:hypothetical protein
LWGSEVVLQLRVPELVGGSDHAEEPETVSVIEEPHQVQWSLST